MNKIILTLILVAVSLNLSAQIKPIQDKSLRAHNARMVHKSWGEFRPYQEHFLDPNYALVWGWLAPKQNKKYKKGDDIRPLKPTGTQSLRYLAAYNSYQNSKKIKEKSDSIGNYAVDEFVYYDKTVSKADPIWLLYFKEVLKPIRNYNKLNPYYDKKLDIEVIKILRETGVEELVISEMELLKDRLNFALDSDMERGQRLIFYHRILEDFRSFDRSLNHRIYISSVFQRFKSKNTNTTQSYDIDYTKFKDMNDVQIMKNIIHKINN